ncbi:hypothetical protein HFP89_08350 [Wenzhouxiangella sp. XN79A]|uniref:BLUF domain-containing protein n=1 Tax=Wenzhouxiangella sp. XN79A TaxID=2724193 RepID=UPI00144A9D50|nr:BLUF domain-containing protein [Wenzhouxiangella sp. XN79A]NKI35175.1 hypothetical protein [Wenzhouxiangella sp. XN79A]
MNLTDRFKPGAMVRAAFCSEANFSHWADPRGPELEVSRILYPAPQSLHFQVLGGVFHSGDRYYLQVIEGPVESVEWYLMRTEHDPRHTRFHLICADAIEQRAFRPGTLRHVGTHEQLHELHRQHGFEAFDPYRYSAEMIAAFVGLAAETTTEPARAS